jgi:hypothetical protein
MIFETEYDLVREKKAIETFVNIFKGHYEKLDRFDIDYKIFDCKYNLIAFAEVKGRNKYMADAYPLPISVSKIVKILDKRINPVIIWSCKDGIIYAKVKDIVATMKWGGRREREGAANDMELMAYYTEQKEFKHIYFENTSYNI